MKPVYITSVGCISPQETFDNARFLDTVREYEDNVLSVVDPVYKDYIPPAAARRMAKGIKMGVVASRIALDEAGLDQVDAIITGTGLGCTIDSEKFVSAMIDNQEQYLTPTSFIQSTHNTVGGQIALGLDCKAYNFTYVHGSISFESALLDALMQLQADEAHNILVGGIDETGPHTVAVHKLVNHIKKDKVRTRDFWTDTTEGAVFGEGAGFFVLSNAQQQGSYAELVGLETYNTLPEPEIVAKAEDFLARSGLKPADVDLLVLGRNGDPAFDGYYEGFAQGPFADRPRAVYKHLCGEFYTASSFGLWMAAQMIKRGSVPEGVLLDGITAASPRTILLYNQYRGENHGFTLLRKC